MSVKTKIMFLFLAVFLTSVFFTTCESPMGMGDSIDWEPPVLKLDPVPSPLYVRNGTKLTGTATDNIKVTKVVLSNSITGEILSTGKLNGDNFEFNLSFDESRNNEKIMARIDAYDRAGNNDSRSSAFITIIIDIRDPIIEKKYIQRTDARIASLLGMDEFRKLETEDSNGEKKDNIYKYQNGWFRFDAEMDDEETQVAIVSLKIYDVKAINSLLLEIQPDPGTNTYSPKWTIHEEDIINAGEAKWPGTGYKDNYYNNNERYYYRVVVSAEDKSKNIATNVEEDEGFICLWARSDEPKGIFDTSVYVKDKAVSRAAQLPVDFFDDDMLSWAYAGLITKAQWEGINPLASDVYICGATVSGQSAKTEQEKIQWLKDKITGLTGETVDGLSSSYNPTIYNWRYDKHNDTGSDAKFINQITTSVDEKLVYIPVGNDNADYGDYVLFTITADKKTFLGGGVGPEWTNKNIWRYKIWDFSVVDQNLALIVFDTTKTTDFPVGSPEENTFPELDSGEYFIIHGYTLRDAGAKPAYPNSVTTFRMAWIPNALATDVMIEDVKVNLKSGDYTTSNQNIKYFNAKPNTDVTAANADGNLNFQTVGDIDKTDLKSRIQKFSIKFSVLNDFMYEGVNENTTKLFIFYAQDNMKNDVYRELRLLGSKSVPEVTVYDATNNIDNSNFNFSSNADPSVDNGLPDPNKYTDSSGGLNDNYYIQLDKANDEAYGTIKSGVGDLSLISPSVPFLQYPRGTILKYWLKVKKTGVVDIASITMEDTTYSGKIKKVGKADLTELTDFKNEKYYSLSFCEYYPDVSQRTFLFTVKDKLGNEAKVQRTIAVTNAAQLDNISTTKVSATYGAGTEIILQANFSGQVYLKEDKDVYLNVTYDIDNVPKYDRLPVKTRPTQSKPLLALEFVFKVPLNASGQLRTMNDSITGGTDKKPLDLDGNKILDSLRTGEGGGEAEAFVPGVNTGSISVPNWSDDKKSLQEKKTIMLDGKKPVITTASVGGKDPYLATNQYYFKSGETIELTLSTDASTGKEISVKGKPALKYRIKQSGGTLSTYNTTAFAYARPDGAKSLVFTLPTNNISPNVDGELVEVTLITDDASNTIIDNYDNPAETSLTDLLVASGKRVFIKKTAPLAPTSITGITNFGKVTEGIKLNTEPTITIGASSSVWTDKTPPAETFTWESAQFSTDNGVTWSDGSTFPLTSPFNNTVQVRYIDRAGNEGAALKQLIQVNTGFPKLVAVSATQSNGWYKKGANLEFNLSFASAVNVTNQLGVSITLTNEGQTYKGTNPDSYTDQKVLTAEAGTNVTTVKFKWNNISDREMQQGLYISRISLGGLSDSFGNIGGTGTGTGGAPTSNPMSNPIQITPVTGASYSTVINLPAGGIKVDAIAPAIDTTASDGGRTPQHNIAPTSSDNDITEIKLTFKENVMKGNGVITIRPRGSYAIPPVLRDSGYYLSTTGGEFTSAAADRTYISSFYDIYNNSALGSTERGYLTEGSSMSKVDLNERTGQSKGPYKKTTHGLIEGAGYTGNYTNTSFAGRPGTGKLENGSWTNATENNGANGPNLSGTGSVKAMIPDTSTKWVLDYQYLIDDTTADSAVSRIRGVLTKAKWRWQEIDVVSTTITTNVVTIKLNEPLLKGLEWDVYYPEGTFTDLAGNPAAASGVTNTDPTKWTNSDYFFMSPGVQPPVIRVDRRSYDGRNSDWKKPISDFGSNGGADGSFTPPTASTSGWSANSYQVADKGLATDGGWGIQDFNSIHYRVESETPGATITVKYYKGSYTNKSGAKGGWGDNDVGTTNGDTSKGVNWSVDSGNVPGTWILPNIIQRSSTGDDSFAYEIRTKYDTYEKRQPRGSFRGFRSYNKDLTKTDLAFDSSTLTTVDDFNSTYKQGVLTGFTDLESSKSYIVARSGKNGKTADGCEGIFRTVIVFNFGTTGLPTNDNLFVEGSNIKNGMPSIAGFPVRDAEEQGDARFVKRFHKYSSDRTQFYWVSTEIVCEWYFLCFGGGGSHQSVGEVNNYLTVGYGDLTFGRGITRYGM